MVPEFEPRKARPLTWYAAEANPDACEVTMLNFLRQSGSLTPASNDP